MNELITPQGDEDLFPTDEEGQAEVVDWARRVYKMAAADKRLHQDRWDKYYVMYRSYVKRRPVGDWKSRVWIPIAFFVIETVTPRLVAQLPSFSVLATRPEFVDPAEQMEELLKWASEQSELYLALVEAIKSGLLYGTGILKTSYVQEKAYEIRREPVMEESFAELPMTDPTTGAFVTDLNGSTMTQRVSLGAKPTGEQTVTRREYIRYEGPKAEAVDIENFFIDPAASTVDNARFVIHRVYRDRAHLEEMFNAGIYKRPPEEVWNSWLREHAALRRQQLVNLSQGIASGTDLDRSLIELFEFWTDKTIVTIAGGSTGQEIRGGILLRVERNPYAHGEKPFVRIVDHLVPHEFWGIGELEPLEGLQDLLNKLWNSRVDNVSLVLNTMFLAVMDYVEDPSDLQARPGGIVRVKDGVPLNQAVQPLNLGEVTQSSYEEASEAERMVAKVSNVSELTAGSGVQDPSLGRTATGMTLVSETGNARFAHKVKIAELTGFKHLARQFASMLQQFAPPEIVIRRLGPQGAQLFSVVTPDSIMGRFDFDIETESSTQTESIRREQALSLFQLLAMDPYMKPLRMREDILKVFGRKNVQDYIYTEEELMMLQQQAAAQEQAAAGQEANGTTQ